MRDRKPIFPNVIEVNHQLGEMIGCNVYLVFDRDEWILIDVGYTDTIDEVLEMVRQLDFPLSNCKTLVATHADLALVWQRIAAAPLASATLVVLVRDAHDLERWREVQAHTAVGVAHLDHADDATGKLRQLVQSPNVAGDIVADVVAGLANDLNGTRGTLAHIARRSRAEDRQR